MDRISSLRQYLEKTPDDSFLLHALALEYVKTGDDAAARDVFRELLRKDPGYTGSYYHLAKTLERLGELPAAIQIYEKGMEVAKANQDGHSFNELQAAWEDISDI